MNTFFDANRYTGRWYEWGRYPYVWEDEAYGTCAYATADYSILEGHLRIVNTCYTNRESFKDSPSACSACNKSSQNQVRTALGIRTVLRRSIKFNDSSLIPQAQYSVTFDNTKDDPTASTRKGEYIIAYTDYEMFSIVLSPKENIAWILLRDLDTDTSMLNTIESIATGFGIDLGRMRFVEGSDHK